MIIIDPEHFRARILQDALTEATSQYWNRRAVEFEAVGTPTCDQIALNCRHHADLIRENIGGPISEEVTTALNEVT